MNDDETAPPAIAGVQPDEARVFTGKLYRGELDGTVRGWLYNHHSGFRIEFEGCRDPRRRGYLLAGKVVSGS